MSGVEVSSRFRQVNLCSWISSFQFLDSLTCNFSSASCPRSPRCWGNLSNYQSNFVYLFIFILNYVKSLLREFIQEAVLEQQDVSDILHQFCLFLMRLYYKGQFQIIVINANYVTIFLPFVKTVLKVQRNITCASIKCLVIEQYIWILKKNNFGKGYQVKKTRRKIFHAIYFHIKTFLKQMNILPVQKLKHEQL